MTSQRFVSIVLSFLFFVSLLIAEDNTSIDKERDLEYNKSLITQPFWERDWVTSSIDTGTLHGYPRHDYGFVVHTVGDPSKLIVYSFYLIPDLHVGDCAVTDQEIANDSFADYNLEGWEPNLNLDRNPDNMG